MKKTYILLIFVLIKINVIGQNYESIPGQEGFAPLNIKPTVYPQLDISPIINAQHRQNEYEIAKRQAEYEKNRRNILECIKITNELYNSAKNFPLIIPNGWHTVTGISGENECSDSPVKVLNNKIVELNEEGFVKKNGYIISISPPIDKGKTIIQFKKIATGKTEFVTMYFLVEIFK